MSRKTFNSKQYMKYLFHSITEHNRHNTRIALNFSEFDFSIGSESVFFALKFILKFLPYSQYSSSSTILGTSLIFESNIFK